MQWSFKQLCCVWKSMFTAKYLKKEKIWDFLPCVRICIAKCFNAIENTFAYETVYQGLLLIK